MFVLGLALALSFLVFRLLYFLGGLAMTKDGVPVVKLLPLHTGVRLTLSLGKLRTACVGFQLSFKVVHGAWLNKLLDVRWRGIWLLRSLLSVGMQLRRTGLSFCEDCSLHVVGKHVGY